MPLNFKINSNSYNFFADKQKRKKHVILMLTEVFKKEEEKVNRKEVLRIKRRRNTKKFEVQQDINVKLY